MGDCPGSRSRCPEQNRPLRPCPHLDPNACARASPRGFPRSNGGSALCGNRMWNDPDASTSCSSGGDGGALPDARAHQTSARIGENSSRWFPTWLPTWSPTWYLSSADVASGYRACRPYAPSYESRTRAPKDATSTDPSSSCETNPRIRCDRKTASQTLIPPECPGGHHLQP